MFVSSSGVRPWPAGAATGKTGTVLPRNSWETAEEIRFVLLSISQAATAPPKIALIMQQRITFFMESPVVGVGRKHGARWCGALESQAETAVRGKASQAPRQLFHTITRGYSFANTRPIVQ